MARKLVVEIVGDASSLNRAFGQASRGGSRLGRSLTTLGRAATVGVGAAFVGLAATLKVGFGELSEGQKVAAQTAAALKSTGGVANVTAKEVDALAQSLSALTGVDDELIQSGENLILTFKNVRNEVGEGANIFDRATAAALDLSARGFGSVESNAIRLGKALNDPIKGMTALSRAGITFSEDQKKTIKALVDTGHALDAQKLILAEVESQVGGSAKAFGETLPGQLSKLRNSFEEAAGRIAATLLPHLMSLLDWVNTHMPEIETVITAVVGGIEKAFQGIGAAVEVAKGPLGDFKTFLEENPGKAKILAGAVLGLATALGIAAGAQLALNLAILLNPYVAAIAAIGALAGALVALYLTNKRVHEAVNDLYADIKRIAIPTLEILRQAWDRFGKALGAIVVAIVRTVTIPFQNAYDIIVGTFRAFAAIFRGDWQGLWKAVLQIVDAFGGNLVRALASHVKAVFATALAIGMAIVDGIKAGVSAAWSSLTSWIGEKMSALKDAITHPWRIGSPSKVTIDIGQQIAEGLGVGFGLGMVAVEQKVADKINSAIDAMVQAVQSRQSALGDAFSELTSNALSAFDKLSSEIETKTEAKIRRQDERRAAQERSSALSEAQTGLTAAQAGGDTQAILDAQRAVEEAKFAIQRAADEKRAAKERDALNDRRELQRRHFEEQLAALQNHLLQGETTRKQANDRLIALFKKYEVPFKNAATKLMGALGEGIREAGELVAQRAQAVKNEIMKHLSNIQVVVNIDVRVPDVTDRENRQHGGPVRRGRSYIVGEAGPELFVPATSGQIIPGGSGGAAMAGGGIVLNFYGPTVGTSRDFEDTVRRAISDVQRRNVTSGL